jgi:flagellar biosynthetic protein FliO
MSTASTLALFGRLIVSLAVVIGLMWAAARVIRKRGFGGVGGPSRRPGVQVDIVARRTLGRNSSIAIVRAGGTALVVGITEHQITKLADASLEEIDFSAESQWTASPQGPDGPTPSWKAMLDQLRDRTARR